MPAYLPGRSHASLVLLIGYCILGVLTTSRLRAEAPDSDVAVDKKAAEKKINDKIKEVAGTAEFLRSLPKLFATLKVVDPAGLRVTLLIEGESLAKVWPLTADAEIKCAGWWGRLGQLTIGDRVWVWFKNDRNKQPVAVAMIADEPSEQDIHGPGVTVVATGAGTITLKPVAGKIDRTIKISKAGVYRGAMKAAPDTFRTGERLYVQTGPDGARLILDPAAFETRRAAQKVLLRKRWTEEGLPGAVVFLHMFSGEMDIMLDHEAMRWAR